MTVDTYEPGHSALGSAANWVNAVVQGPLLTSLAIIAIAAVGLGMLGGRLSIKRGATVILGCFVVFGASSIAQGIVGLVYEQAPPMAEVSFPAPVPKSEFVVPEARPPAASDPYAGASLRN